MNITSNERHADRPLRVLHCLGQLGRGGVEVWLMNVLRNIDRGRYQFDFLVHSDPPGPFADEARSLGSQIYYCPPPAQNPLLYARRLRRVLREHGPFDVVHSHLYYFSGYIAKVSARAGSARRIVHSHTDERARNRERKLLRRLYFRVSKSLIRRYATGGLACSAAAAAALYGENWRDDPRWQVLLYGIDFSRFERIPTRPEAKRRLGIPASRAVLGHVGRFVHVKNHEFLVCVFQHLVARGHDVHLLLVGSGELESTIRAQLAALGLADRTLFAGDQPDVAPYLAAMDCKVFPSRFEGLGIVVLEALAAGVPTVTSSGVPTEVDVIPEMVRHLSLDAGVSIWADQVLQFLNSPQRHPRDTVPVLSESPFGLCHCLQSLDKIYHPVHFSSVQS